MKMAKFILGKLGACAIALLLSVGTFAGDGFLKIHVNELDTQIKAKKQNLVIFDANTESTRKNVGIIPGAHLLKSSTDYDIAKELPHDKNSPLVFYCANEQCTASHSAARRALSAGYTNVSVMVDGIYGWQKAGKPLSQLSTNSQDGSPQSGNPQTGHLQSGSSTTGNPQTDKNSAPATTAHTAPVPAVEISPNEAYKLTTNKEAIIVDVRENAERTKVIEGALWFPTSQIQNEQKWKEFKKQLPSSKMIVFHCMSGVRSKKVAQLLSKEGGYRAAYFEGPDQWEVAGLHLIKGPAQ